MRFPGIVMEERVSSVNEQSVRKSFLKAFRRLLVAYVTHGIEDGLNRSFLMRKRYPDEEDRRLERVLRGMTDMTNVEFLRTLPDSDPRRRKLKNIVYPSPHRRCELEQTLSDLDTYLVAVSRVPTRSLYETVARLGWNGNTIFEKEKDKWGKQYSRWLKRLKKRTERLYAGAAKDEVEIFRNLLEYLITNDELHNKLILPDLGEDLE